MRGFPRSDEVTMRPPIHLGAAIACVDLAVLSEVALLRLPPGPAESHRSERMRAVVDAEAALARALAAHARCAAVHDRGSHGAARLDAATETLCAALATYAHLVQRIATEYRRSLSVPDAPLAAFPGADASAQLLAG